MLPWEGAALLAVLPELVVVPTKWFGCSGKGQPLSGPGAIPAVLHLARQGKNSLPLTSHVPSTWLAGYISLGTGDRPGDICWHGSNGVQGGLYFVLSYPSCPAPTMGVAFDHVNCRRVVVAPKHYQGLGAWWHNHAPGTGRGPRLFFSSLTKMHLLQVGSSPAEAPTSCLPCLLPLQLR